MLVPRVVALLPRDAGTVLAARSFGGKEKADTVRELEGGRSKEKGSGRCGT